MEPIINPIWIYFINVSENLSLFFILAGILLLAGGVIVTFAILDDSSNAEEFKKRSKPSIRAAIFGLIFLILSIFIPSKDTCYQMIALNMVTPNNIEAMGESAEDFVDYVFDNIDKLLEDGTASADEEGD